MNTSILRLRASLATAAVLTLAIAGAAPAAAREKPAIAAGDWEIGFGVGGAELDSQVSDGTDRRTELRGGYFLSDHLELELQAARTDATLDATVDQLFANAAWHFAPGRAAVPYLLVGVGQARIADLSIFGPGEGTEAGLAWQAAVGSRFYFGAERRVAARLELSASFDDALPETDRHVGLTGGLVWRIGR